MKRLILTTALVAAFAPAQALAQTADPATTEPAAPGSGMVTPPEGFQMVDTMLSAADLLGQPVHDANGESIGDLSDLVFSIADGAVGTEADMLEETSDPGAAGTDAGSDTGNSETGTGSTGDTETSSGEATTGMTEGPSGASQPASQASSEATTETDSDPEAADGQTPPAEAEDERTATNMTSAGQVSHAVIDIGGFLGVGEHSVAIPVTDLAIYRNGSDTRVYLPWSREQLEAVPAYNSADPTTLGKSQLPTVDE